MAWIREHHRPGDDDAPLHARGVTGASRGPNALVSLNNVSLASRLVTLCDFVADVAPANRASNCCERPAIAAANMATN